eukprot:Hpha_TRINITY_DN10391_c0_g1::TRINITY_DN10391_c0_g1_i1::g.115991::m.115991
MNLCSGLVQEGEIGSLTYLRPKPRRVLLHVQSTVPPPSLVLRVVTQPVPRHCPNIHDTREAGGGVWIERHIYLKTSAVVSVYQPELERYTGTLRHLHASACGVSTPYLHSAGFAPPRASDAKLVRAAHWGSQHRAAGGGKDVGAEVTVSGAEGMDLGPREWLGNEQILVIRSLHPCARRPAPFDALFSDFGAHLVHPHHRSPRVARSLGSPRAARQSLGSLASSLGTKCAAEHVTVTLRHMAHTPTHRYLRLRSETKPATEDGELSPPLSPRNTVAQCVHRGHHTHLGCLSACPTHTPSCLGVSGLTAVDDEVEGKVTSG